MQATDYLLEYSKKADLFLANFFKQKKKEAEKISPQAREVIETFENYVAGGKKVRGALTVLGYKIAGGKELLAILPASCGVEVLHNFLLIQDDWIDQDELRRGKPTVHEKFATFYGQHLGASMAIVVGDAGAFLGYELIASSQFPKIRITKALSLLNQILLKTAYGEVFDITFDFKEKISWDDILLVRTYKTAYYTFVMPLSVGAILAGANFRLVQSIERYGIPVGLAFQLQDDILGVFGEEEKTGKPADSDIKEGKKTFLWAKTMELAERQEQEFLKRHYGSSEITSNEIERIRQIIEKSKAPDYSKKLAKELVGKGKMAISAITKNKDYQETLSTLADFVVERDR